ncbi:MAG: acyl-CoA dehydrogenase family protein [Sphingomonas sp.]|jgi:alkylation response protein AidB-like acyl-CoA dehydrogenase|uniref:acyl-CoA dehydrogenase family protein n=1 Tax=Sphingomonas sp. TaxID=28214 RepID=UPI0035619EB7
MDLDFNEEQELLRTTVRRICNEHFDSARVRRLEVDEHKFSRPFWAALSENGLCALRVDEAHGGAAMSALDLAVTFEEFGRTLASSPYLQSCVHAAHILSRCGADAEKAEWLARIASGEAIVVPTVEADASYDTAAGTLRGAALLVPFASVADAFLVGCGDDGWALVMADAEGITIRPQANYAAQALFAVTFDGAGVRAFLTGRVETCSDVLIAAAAEAVGASDALLAMTADYANQRNQFGKPIAAFQAISHPLAECATELEGARYLTYQAAWAQDEGLEHLTLARMAKLRATRLYRRLAMTSVQVHGGVGYSTEGDPQLFYRRSKFQELMNGAPDTLKRAIADHVLA